MLDAIADQLFVESNRIESRWINPHKSILYCCPANGSGGYYDVEVMQRALEPLELHAKWDNLCSMTACA